jgi:hypothetical protein
LDDDLACIYRAYATCDRPLKIASPRNTPDNAWDLV